MEAPEHERMHSLTIVKICRLLICKCFVCEKTGFVVVLCLIGSQCSFFSVGVMC